jgi:hypothetical protein
VAGSICGDRSLKAGRPRPISRLLRVAVSGGGRIRSLLTPLHTNALPMLPLLPAAPGVSILPHLDPKGLLVQQRGKGSRRWLFARRRLHEATGLF